MTATRVIVISDLHLGGTAPQMMSRPSRLTEFIRGLPRELSADEGLELVVAGDFVDFLAIAPFESWTSDPVAARQKLEQTMREPSLAPVFDALGRLVADGHWLTIMIGNHDVEMALQPTQEAFLRRIGASPHQVLFIDDGRAHRIGKVLIEHGNRYDDANHNDWTGLRAIVSALSRGEAPKDRLRVSAGSQIVEHVVSPLKRKYPFIDLLQPQGELTALLLYAFEPALGRQIDKIAWVLRGQILQNRNRGGLQPGRTRYVAYRSDDHDPELAFAFDKVYQDLRTPRHQVSVREWLKILPARDGLSAIFERNEHLPDRRLGQIRVSMRKLLLGEESAKFDGATQQYGAAAKRILAEAHGEIKVVIMGHTHLARHIGDREQASYINTGTWTDVVRVPPETLADDGGKELEEFLRSLKNNTARQFVPTYADLRVEANGDVQWAKLVRAPN